MTIALRAAIALTILAPVPAFAAAAPAAGRDVRCLMLSNLFAKAAPDANGKAAAAEARMFYLGRVSSKFSQPQLQTAMNAEAKTIDPGKVGGDMNACFVSVQAAAAAVEVAGTKARSAVLGAGVAGKAVVGR